MEPTEGRRKYRKLLSSASNTKNRSHFLTRCIEEKVIPSCTPFQPKLSEHIFPEYIQLYLKKSIDKLHHLLNSIHNQIKTLRTQLHNENALPSNLEAKIKLKIQEQNKKHAKSLELKLVSLCRKSRWKEIGRPDLVMNLSNYNLTDTETEALSLGLKFSTGGGRYQLTDLISRNYRHTDSDFTKGFIQGILISATTPSNFESSIPKRYVLALKKLKRNNNIHITPSDKSGGIVIMDRNNYIDKMSTLLQEDKTYSKTNEKTILLAIQSFNKSYKNLTSQENPFWKSLIEYHPRIPSMYGLPKTHKTNIPLRPITSSIGSTPHRIAKAIANILSPFLGSISQSHIANSGELLNRLKHIDTTTMSLASLDVTSLFTNVPVTKCLESLTTHLKEKVNTPLPLPIDKIIKICTLCTNLNFFQFEDSFYKQTSGLPMGSPLSPVLACLYLETLESGPFEYIIPRNSHYFRYIDDVLFLHPQNVNIPNLVKSLSSVEPSINFTFETEYNHRLPFLDILIHKDETGFSYNVYRKPTNQNDYIHFFSHHSNKIKSGIIIGSYLRALRICSHQFLQTEESHIEKIFKSLSYPAHFILNARRKAYKIHNRNNNIQNNSNNVSHNNNSTNTTSNKNHSKNSNNKNNPANKIMDSPNDRYLVLPNNKVSTMLAENLKIQGFKLVTTTSDTIRSLLNKQKHIHTDPEAGIYEIPCASCDLAYYGQSARNLRKRINEHKRDLRSGQTNNSIVKHNYELNHSPRFESAKVLKFCNDPRRRKILESAIIAIYPNINHRPGSYNLVNNIARKIIIDNKIQSNHNKTPSK